MNFLRAISNLLRFDRTNWKALALCFFAAAIFWIFNALNKSYATNLRLPLKFDFDNTKYVAVEPLPNHLTINVSGNGWEIFRKSLGVKVPDVSLALERPADTHKIVAASLSPIVASQIGTLQINYIVTDTLRLKIEPKTTRKVKLRADLSNISFKKDFGRTSPVVILPDSVILEGPKSIIENTPDSISLKVTSSRLHGNFRENAEIIIPNNDLINRNPPVAEVIFDVGPIEEIGKNIKLKMPKLSWGMEVRGDSVRCVFTIPQKEHDQFQIDWKLIQAGLSLPELKKGESATLKPTLRGLPPYAELILVDSVVVKKY